MKLKTYSELSRIKTFEERYNYLVLSGNVGESIFGFDRWVNQRFYSSREWKRVRSDVIYRDNGCDLGVPGYEIHSGLLVHHMNPIVLDDFDQNIENILNPEYLITTTQRTHNAIHYGDASQLPQGPIERTPGDTTLW